MKETYKLYEGRIKSAKSPKAIDQILLYASYEATPGNGLTNREMNKLVYLGHEKRVKLQPA